MSNLDRPTLPERYASAVDSSHLEVLPDRCAIDYLIAAGWVRDGLGAQLMRLRAEYDAARGERIQAATNRRHALQRVDAFKRAADAINAAGAKYTQAEVEAAAKRAEQAEAEAKREARTAQVLLMVHLKSLSAAVEAVHNFAVVTALRTRFLEGGAHAPYRSWQGRRRAAVRAIASRVLDVWISPSCGACSGRGFHGGYKEPVTLCRTCGGSTLRLGGQHGERLASTESGHAFGMALYDALNEKTGAVARRMALYVSRTNGSRADAEQEQQALRARLAVLRSAQAQED